MEGARVRLLNWGPGECSDRLTILALKILHGTDAGKDVKHFTDERNALLTDIRARTLNGKWFEAVLELAAVNAALWHAEDRLRMLRAHLERALSHQDLHLVGTLRPGV